MEKVSVIIPVYNAEKFLYDCLESVRKQTYRNIEVIMINDGSTDSSGSICRFFVKLIVGLNYLIEIMKESVVLEILE